MPELPEVESVRAALAGELAARRVDGVRLPDGAYLDIGAPVAGGQVLPVVIKTLIL